MDLRILILVSSFSLGLAACGNKNQQISTKSRPSIYDAWDARYVYEMETRRMVPFHKGREVGRTWGRDEKGKINYASYLYSRDKGGEDLFVVHSNRLDRLREKKWDNSKKERIDFIKNQLDILKQDENSPLIEVPVEDEAEEFLPPAFLPQGIDINSAEAVSSEDATEEAPPAFLFEPLP
mgnify:FL=1